MLRNLELRTGGCFIFYSTVTVIYRKVKKIRAMRRVKSSPDYPEGKVDRLREES